MSKKNDLNSDYATFIKSLGTYLSYERTPATGSKAAELKRSTLASMKDVKRVIESIQRTTVFNNISPVKSGICWTEAVAGVVDSHPKSDPYNLWKDLATMYYDPLYAGSKKVSVGAKEGEETCPKPGDNPGDTAYLIALINGLKKSKRLFFLGKIVFTLATTVNMADPVINDKVTSIMWRIADILLDDRASLDLVKTSIAPPAIVTARSADQMTSNHSEEYPYELKSFKDAGAVSEKCSKWDGFTGFPVINQWLIGFTPAAFFEQGMYHCVITTLRLQKELEDIRDEIIILINQLMNSTTTPADNDYISTYIKNNGYDKYSLDRPDVAFIKHMKRLTGKGDWVMNHDDLFIHISEDFPGNAVLSGKGVLHGHDGALGSQFRMRLLALNKPKTDGDNPTPNANSLTGMATERRYMGWYYNNVTRIKAAIESVRRGTDAADIHTPKVLLALESTISEVETLVSPLLESISDSVTTYGKALYLAVSNKIAADKSLNIVIPDRYKIMAAFKIQNSTGSPFKEDIPDPYAIDGNEYICGLGLLDLWTRTKYMKVIFETLVSTGCLIDKANPGQSIVDLKGIGNKTDNTIKAYVNTLLTPIKINVKPGRPRVSPPPGTNPLKDDYTKIHSILTADIDKKVVNTFPKPLYGDAETECQWLSNYYNSKWDPSTEGATYIPTDKDGKHIPETPIPNIVEVLSEVPVMSNTKKGQDPAAILKYDAIIASQTRIKKAIELCKEDLFKTVNVNGNIMSAVKLSNSTNEKVRYELRLLDILINATVSMVMTMKKLNPTMEIFYDIITFPRIDKIAYNAKWRETLDVWFFTGFNNIPLNINDIRLCLHALNVVVYIICQSFANPNEAFGELRRMINDLDIREKGVIKLEPSMAYLFGKLEYSDRLIYNIHNNMSLISTLVHADFSAHVTVSPIDNMLNTYACKLKSVAEPFKSSVPIESLDGREPFTLELKVLIIRYFYVFNEYDIATELPTANGSSMSDAYTSISEMGKALVYLQTVKKTLSSEIMGFMALAPPTIATGNASDDLEAAKKAVTKITQSDVIKYFYEKVLREAIYLGIQKPFTTMFTTYSGNAPPENKKKGDPPVRTYITDEASIRKSMYANVSNGFDSLIAMLSS